MIEIKRVYEAPAVADGHRVLVDRLWPRGLRREHAAIDAWLKDLAPSSGLRQWFAHDAERWPEFQRRFREELAAPAVLVHLQDLRARARSGNVTLLFAARDATRCNASVLRDVLLELPLR